MLLFHVVLHYYQAHKARRSTSPRTSRIGCNDSTPSPLAKVRAANDMGDG